MTNQASVEKRSKHASPVPHDDIKHLALLYCASTDHFFVMPDLELNIADSSARLNLETNNGMSISTKKGLYDGSEV